jgi:serine/threonine protein kinase
VVANTARTKSQRASRGDAGARGAKSELTGLGPWRLVEAIGAGERATVYRATHVGGHGTNEARAVKVLHGLLAHDPDAAKAFEVRLQAHAQLSRLDHPNIVHCHGVEITAGRPYAVLDLVDAVSLDKLMPERGRAKVSVEAGANLVIAILDALAAAANEKIAHGRLAANDVLVHPDGMVQVTGFGQAGDLRMDFLAVHRLIQSLNTPWPPEVDAWLDALSAERSAWKDLRAARAAFPLSTTEAGRKALERSVRNRRKKEQKALEEAQAEAEAGEEAEVEDAGYEEEVEETERRPKKKARVQKPVAVRRAEALQALRQARITALAALAIVLVALAMEVLGVGK